MFAALKTTPTPQKEPSNHQIIICLHNFLLLHDLAVCSYIREQMTHKVPKVLSKDVLYLCSNSPTICLSPVRCDVGEGGFFVRCGRGLGSGLRSPWSPSYGPYHC